VLGYFVLGPKKSGNPYTAQDIRAIETIANEMVIAIQNALRFEEIERFNITLQQKVEEATRKLRRTNEKLRQLDETKDDFISMASHQLRTPLTSVKGYVSMVVEGDAGELNPMQKKLLNQAFISAQRMVYLISDLLNVSRLRTGKFIIEPVQSNLANIVQEEVRQLIPTAKGRGLELVYHRPEHFPILMFDETKMRQVIMNFIDNAIYYTPTGGTITVSMVDKPTTIEFSVVDTGIGVPKSDQHHLFSKFYRANNAKRARPDGTGLGLFMAKKVIVAQGGATIFKSQEGKGSTFGFTFAKEPLLPTRPPESHVLKH
jgi:signal transduction histidine kinase